MRPLTLEQIAKFSGGEAIGSGVIEQITIRQQTGNGR